MYENIYKELKQSNVELCAVSKTFQIKDILEIYEKGQRIFGENKVQELLEKYSTLPKSIKWHFVGHLQSNKVKYIAPFIDLIHAVDSLSLLKEINKRAIQNQRKIPILLQLKIAQEDSKFGISPNSFQDFIKQIPFDKYHNIDFKGLMGMATNTINDNIIRQEMTLLRTLYDQYTSFFVGLGHSFDTCSMGMSSDYKIAIEAGSTIVRIGSLIFGKRNYSI